MFWSTSVHNLTACFVLGIFHFWNIRRCLKIGPPDKRNGWLLSPLWRANRCLTLRSSLVLLLHSKPWKLAMQTEALVSQFRNTLKYISQQSSFDENAVWDELLSYIVLKADTPYLESFLGLVVPFLSKGKIERHPDL